MDDALQSPTSPAPRYGEATSGVADVTSGNRP
jgi:hypothetical protein